ncbi:MAG TPA: aminotransferase class I/II-fold pyridoxal phosphate-dependent enzyme [Streptosporangiaceae bacterium]|nr:aminotransferase class I/II-fold pyridoxal phosphate-dependent enzyme [Streptosporangiaceae bacterium]
MTEQQRASATAASLTESVIREMTRLALQHNAINLAQGFPDFPAPDEVKRAAVAAIEADQNQYPITWGQASIREALADKYRQHYEMVVDPERNVCVTCGATEAMIAAMVGCVDPGQEVIVFEPFYENYGAAAAIAGAVPRYVTLREPGWSFDEAELAAAFTSRTRAIVINTPGNPTGKVFSEQELAAIARLCQRRGVLAITDEIYEHIVYDGARHIPMATVAGMEDRTITISALSKSYAVTGWRVGWAIAPPDLTDAIRRVHDFVTVGAPTPFQEAGAVALRLPGSYYERLAADYTERRDLMLDILATAGLEPASRPSGAYYVMCDASVLGMGDDTATARALTREVGVASVPGSSFYSRRELGRSKIRFSYSKKLGTLHEAGRRLARLAPDPT